MTQPSEWRLTVWVLVRTTARVSLALAVTFLSTLSSVTAVGVRPAAPQNSSSTTTIGQATPGQQSQTQSIEAVFRGVDEKLQVLNQSLQAASQEQQLRTPETVAAAQRYYTKASEAREALPALVVQIKTLNEAVQAFQQGQGQQGQGAARELPGLVKNLLKSSEVLQGLSVEAQNYADALRVAQSTRQVQTQGKVENLQQAVKEYKAALVPFQALMFTFSGLVYNLLSDYQQALTYYNQAFALYQSTGNSAGEANTIAYIGGIYSILGDQQKSFDSYNRALTLYKSLNDTSGQANAIANIGDVYRNRDERQKALDSYNRALSLFKSLNERAGEASVLTKVGQLYANTNEYQQAIDVYNRAISIYQATGDRLSLIGPLNGIGSVYESLGDYQKALDSYNQFLLLAKTFGSRDGEAVALNEIGHIYLHGQKDYPKALATFKQVLPLFEATSNPVGKAVTLTAIGITYGYLGEYQEAIASLNQALPLEQALENRAQQSYSLSNIGSSYGKLGQRQKALDYLNQALALFRTTGDRSGEAAALYQVALIERDLGNLNEARKQIEAALAIVESLRTKVTSQELRSSFFASVQDYYNFYIDLLMQLHQQHPKAGYDALALAANERSRARSLVELLTEAKIDIRQGVAPTLLQQERRLQQQIDAQTASQLQLTKQSPAQQAATKQQLDNLLSQLQQVQAQIRQSSPRYAALTQPQALKLSQIQQLLEPDTVLLEYSLGEKRSYLWAVTPTSITSYELPNQPAIEKAARQFYQLLTDRRYALVKPDLTQVAANLSQMLLKPVASGLGQKRLIVVSDGALQYIPFGALPEPGTDQQTPLLVKHEVVSLPSVSTLAVVRRELAGRQPAIKTVAVFADPVFDASDPRVQSPQRETNQVPISLQRSASDVGIKNLPRLPGTQQEAEQILALVPATMREQAFGFAANRASASNPDLSQYRLIHFATHGLLNSENPQLSGVVLSLVDQQGKPQDGFLGLGQVYNLKLSAELVVLSACQTGLGADVRGEGLVGLTRGFMYAGTPRVVASLWSVDDAATAELMQRFYRGMLQDKLRPAAALRAAQVSVWKQQRLSAPYYWAAFVLQGEWR